MQRHTNSHLPLPSSSLPAPIFLLYRYHLHPPPLLCRDFSCPVHFSFHRAYSLTAGSVPSLQSGIYLHLCGRFSHWKLRTMHRLKTSSFVARKFSPPLSLFLPLARLRSLTFYLYYFPPLPLASYPSPSSFPFSRVSCTTYTPSFITLRSSIFISRSPEIFTVFFVLIHIQRLHARPRFSPVGIALRDDRSMSGLNVGIFEIGGLEAGKRRG